MANGFLEEKMTSTDPLQLLNSILFATGLSLYFDLPLHWKLLTPELLLVTPCLVVYPDPIEVVFENRK
jgi:hypothetical protein